MQGLKIFLIAITGGIVAMFFMITMGNLMESSHGPRQPGEPKTVSVKIDPAQLLYLKKVGEAQADAMRATAQLNHLILLNKQKLQPTVAEMHGLAHAAAVQAARKEERPRNGQ